MTSDSRKLALVRRFTFAICPVLFILTLVGFHIVSRLFSARDSLSAEGAIFAIVAVDLAILMPLLQIWFALKWPDKKTLK